MTGPRVFTEGDMRQAALLAAGATTHVWTVMHPEDRETARAEAHRASVAVLEDFFQILPVHLVPDLPDGSERKATR